MLYGSGSAELRAKGLRLLELAEAREAHRDQRALMGELGRSCRMAAVRPLARSWACSARAGRPKKRWFSFGNGGLDDEADKTADQALASLAELWSAVAPNQYNQLDQELRAGGYWSPGATGAWWQLSPQAALASLPDSGELRSVGLGVLACHPSGHVREAVLRELVEAPLRFSLPFLLVRANDWVRQVRTVAYSHLLSLDQGDVEELAPLLELVLQLASQRRREPGAVEHLLNLLRAPRGLAAVQGCWTSETPSLRRLAIRFSWDESGDRGAVLRAAIDSTDAVLRRWAVEMLASADDPSRAETLRRLTKDPASTVATAALDALDSLIEPKDLDLLEDLRCASSPGLQHAARFMLEKHFGEESHREVYLALLSGAEERWYLAAAIGLAATGQSEDRELLLSTRVGARSKVRQRLLDAAAGLDPAGTRHALFEDLRHELTGVSKSARKLLAERVIDTDASAVSELLQDSKPHVRKNALLLAARLGHWLAVPLILRGTRDTDAEVVDAAGELLDKWFIRHFHGIYRAPEPSDAQEREVRAEIAVCGLALGESARASLLRALAGEWTAPWYPISPRPLPLGIELWWPFDG